MYKKCLIFLLSLFWMTWGAAQTYSVGGRVENALTGEAVELATAALLRTDSTLVAGASTDGKGQFTLKAKAAGSYLVRISFVGFSPSYTSVTLTREQPKADLGVVKLEVNDRVLQEAVVSTTLARVEQKKDTTIFNAGAYSLPEGSTLEALIELLPGVKVSENGAITWNGKPVEELLLNGKDFFKGNKDVPMKNLPTDLVSKVKAYKKKSDYTEQTGIDDGEEKVVLDITTKKELNKTWFASLNGGYGTNDRYTGNLYLSRFTDRSQMSLFGSLGNAGGYGGGGQTVSQHGGADFSWENGKGRREAGKLELGSSLYYHHNRTDMLSSQSSETFLTAGSSSSFSNSFNRSHNSSSSISTSFRVEWCPDSMTSIKFRPSFGFSRNRNNSDSRSATFNADPFAFEDMQNPLDSLFERPDSRLTAIAVNRNERENMSRSENRNVQGELNIVRRLNSKGRNVSLRVNGRYDVAENKSFSISDIHYYNGDDNSFLNQYSTSPSKNWNYDFRLGYAEPITKELVAEARYSYSHRYADNDRSRYNLDRLLCDDGIWGSSEFHPGIGSLPTEADSLAAVRDLHNSQYATYHYKNHLIDLSLKYKTEKMRINAGVELEPQRTELAYNRPGQHIDTLVVRNVFSVSPDVRFRYEFSDDSRMELRYSGQSSQPAMTSLLSVVDNSNPLSVSMGNPGLKPSWSNSVDFDYESYQAESERGFSIGAGYRQSLREVSNLLVYDETTGVSYTRPENIDGNWNVHSYLSAICNFGEEKRFSFNSSTDMNYSHSVGFVSSFASEGGVGELPAGGEPDYDYYDRLFANADIRKSTTRNLQLGERMELGYRKDWLHVSGHGNVNYGHARSGEQERSNMDTWNFGYGLSCNFDFDFGLRIYTVCKVNSRRGYSSASMNTDEVIWDAQLSYSFLKEKAATLSLEFYDLLNQQSNISRVISARMRSDSWTNSVHSYGMLRFIYRFRSMAGGGEKVKKKKYKKYM